jgi:uncharacterized heparinase superfamily protein
LAFLGSCFPADNDLVSGWRRQGRAILHRELPEQILPDGMHFERSPMYHSRITYLLELLHATPFREEFAEPLNRMRSALADLCHPDGEISLFNDSAFGIYNAPADLLGEHRPREGAWALPDAGYYGWRDPDGNYLVCDAGPIGPDYIPGHAHADTFSYELSLRGHRVIVDSGVYDYVPSGMRAYCRSTRAHNTVEVGGADQCELWGAFRVARRGYPKEVNWQPTEDGFRLRGWHTGYQRLPERAVHRREFCWEQAEPRLTVTDRIRARRAVNSVSWVHLHPSCEVTDSVDNTVTIAFPGGTFTIQFSGKGELSREESVYCPEFWRKEQRVALAFRSHSPQSETSYSVLLK